MNKLLVSASVALGATSLSFAPANGKTELPTVHSRRLFSL